MVYLKDQWLSFSSTTVKQMIICTRHLFFSYTFRMFDQNEEAEVSVENELSLEAQSTAPETNIKQKDKQEKKKGIFRSEWLQEFKFLKEYKPDKSQATCIACNNQFSVHCGGKNDVVQHTKTKQHAKNILTYLCRVQTFMIFSYQNQNY